MLDSLDPGAALDPNVSLMSIMHPYDHPDAGDMAVRWDRNNQAEIDSARATYDAMKKKGYSAYKTKADGTMGEMIRDFDPTAERITMTPRVVGG